MIAVQKSVQANGKEMSIISDVWSGVKSFVNDIPTIVKTQAKAGGKILSGDFKGAKDELVSLKQLPIDAAQKEINSRMNTEQQIKSGSLPSPDQLLKDTQFVFALANNTKAYQEGKIDITQYASTKRQIEAARAQAIGTSGTTIGVTPAVINEPAKDQYTMKSTSAIPAGITMSDNTGIYAPITTAGLTTPTTSTMFNKVISFVKTYWYIVVIAGVAIWYFFLRKKR